MMKASKEILQAAVMGFCIPGALLLAIILFFHDGDVPPLAKVTTAPQVSIKPTDPYSSVRYQVSVLIDGHEVTMDLEEYVVGVVLSEMPASFEIEALKAQAVAARTYAMKTCIDGKKHGGSICDDHNCCQGFMTVQDYLLKGWKEKYVQRVQTAVKDTAGLVLIYDNKLIRATYFSCSGGSTEAAVAVWGRDYPYLQAVLSPGEEETVYYTDTKMFTLTEFQEQLGISLDGDPNTWFGDITYTSGGGIDSMVIGGVTYKGTTLRSLLGLRSTVFQVIVSDSAICFETHGYGHRVGMSQYGADAMAIEGESYDQILTHYYCGTEIVHFESIL